jgi:HSP20 family protein
MATSSDHSLGLKIKRMIGSKNKQKFEVLVSQASNDLLTPASSWSNIDNEGQLLLDVYQDEQNLYIKSTIAGVKPEDLEISINNDLLTIRGSRQGQNETGEIDYFYRECYWGSFSRSIILPVEVKHDKISAVLKNGVLTITLPKIEKKRNIPVQIQ